MLLSVALAVAVAMCGGRFFIDALAYSVTPPVVTQWSPQTVTSTAQPVHIAVVGSGLSGVTEVFTSPVVTPRSVAPVSDQAAIVTLPANLAAGSYDLTLVSPAGGSTQPGSILLTVLQPQSSASQASVAAAAPAISLQPAPVAADPAVAPSSAKLPATGGRPAPTSSVVMQTRSALTDSPFFALALGLAIGGLLYALWGKEGRLRVARRRGFLAQLWARPLQRLRLARICLQCGGLHYVFHTRRDLWSAGEFCSATCFVADQEEDIELASSEGVAPTRLRGIGVYTDLEIALKSALRAEASAHGAALFADEVSHDCAVTADEATAATRLNAERISA